MSNTVGIDVGGTKCLGVALDEHGHIVRAKSVVRRHEGRAVCRS